MVVLRGGSRVFKGARHVPPRDVAMSVLWISAEHSGGKNSTGKTYRTFLGCRGRHLSRCLMKEHGTATGSWLPDSLRGLGSAAGTRLASQARAPGRTVRACIKSTPGRGEGRLHEQRHHAGEVEGDEGEGEGAVGQVDGR